MERVNAGSGDLAAGRSVPNTNGLPRRVQGSDFVLWEHFWRARPTLCQMLLRKVLKLSAGALQSAVQGGAGARCGRRPLCGRTCPAAGGSDMCDVFSVSDAEFHTTTRVMMHLERSTRACRLVGAVSCCLGGLRIVGARTLAAGAPRAQVADRPYQLGWTSWKNAQIPSTVPSTQVNWVQPIFHVKSKSRLRILYQLAASCSFELAIGAQVARGSNTHV